MRLDVVHGGATSDEWCVAVDGTYVVGFAGPDARDRAVRQRDELQELFDSFAEGAPAEPFPDESPATLPDPGLPDPTAESDR